MFPQIITSTDGSIRKAFQYVSADSPVQLQVSLFLSFVVHSSHSVCSRGCLGLAEPGLSIYPHRQDRELSIGSEKNIEKGEKAWADMADSAESFEETDLRRSGEDCARNQAAKNDDDPKDYLGVPMLRRCAAKLSSSRTAGTNLFGPSDRGNTCYPCLGSKYQRQQEAQQQRKQQYLVGW